MIPAAIQLNRFRFWASLGLLLICARAPASPDAAWLTRVWKTDDGLINNNIVATAQGADGYLWVAPSVGLMRFDGVRFSNFPIEDFTGSTDVHICTMLCGRTGVLWIAAYGGQVFGLNPDFSARTFPKSSLPESTPLTLAEDKDDSLWLGYADVVVRIQNGRMTQFTATEGVPAGEFHSLISDGAGAIWLAKGKQVCLFRDGQFQPVITVNKGASSLAATRTNAVWFVGDEHLWHCAANGTLQDCGAFPGLANPARRALLQDRAGTVWIGTDDNGLIRYDQSGFQRIETSYSSIKSLADDREGNLWVGTGGGGLDRISLSAVRLETFESNAGLDPVQSICEDAAGRLWGATLHGALVSKINGQWMPLLTNNLFAGNVACVTANGDGIWVGTRDGKLFRMANGRPPTGDWQTTNFQSKISGPVSALLPASNGDLWILGKDTLQRLHSGELKEMALPRKIVRLTAIAEDAHGNVWIGAKGVKGILLRFDGTKFVDESPRLRIADHVVCCLYGTPDGSLWISCGGLGLLRLKDGQVGQVGIEQDLFNDYIAQMVADGRGWLWFASDHGVFKIRQRELEQAMNDSSIRLRPVIYGRDDGLPGLEALFSTSAPFVFPLAQCAHDDRVCLLMRTGIVVADPKLHPENFPPPVLLTRALMDEQTIAAYGIFQKNENGASKVERATRNKSSTSAAGMPLRLPPGHRHLEFDFTAFHFTSPENLHFRYQLAGFDNDWIDARADRHADYSRLTAGDYQFRVEACIGDGPWSDQPATLSFTVLPFFWQRWWFRLGALLLFTSVVIAIVRYISFQRMRRKLRAAEQQAAIERERGRIARDIHDDLGNRLTQIQLLTGLAQRHQATPEKSVTHVREISSTARQATDALDEIVWAINPRNDTLPHLIDYIGQFAVEFLRSANIRCRVNLPEQPPAKAISTEVRHNLFLAIKESLNNIARHSDATEVFLLILITDESIRVIIEDNGRGFNGEVKSNGADGLENMRLRMAEIGGQFQIKSTPGTGTWISFDGTWLAEK